MEIGYAWPKREQKRHKRNRGVGIFPASAASRFAEKLARSAE